MKKIKQKLMYVCLVYLLPFLMCLLCACQGGKESF